MTMLPFGAWLGRYRLDALLGSGAYGEVYRAFDSVQHEIVAIKVMNPTAPASTSTLIAEASRLTGVRGDNLLTIRNADIQSGFPFIAMDLADGEVPVPAVGTPPVEVIRILTQACAGVARIHDAGLLHCDIKPENLFLDGRIVRVGDLGLAVDRYGPTHNAGSPPTQPPEVAAACLLEAAGTPQPGQNSVASDVYALGATAYRLLAGRFPYGYDPFPATREDYFNRVVSVDPPRLIDVAPHVPPLLDRIVARTMARDPANRYDNPADLAAAVAGMPRIQPAWARTDQHGAAHWGCWQADPPNRAPLAVCVIPQGRNWDIEATRGGRRHAAGCRTAVASSQLPVRIRAALNSFTSRRR